MRALTSALLSVALIVVALLIDFVDWLEAPFRSERMPHNAGFAWIGHREIEAPDFSAGKDRSVALPKEKVTQGILSKLDYDFTVTGGTGAGDVLGDAAFRTHDVVHVERAGRAIHHVLGQTLGTIEQMMFEEQHPQTSPTTDAAGTETDRVARVYIPFFVPRAIGGDQFALWTKRDTPINVHVKGGQAQDLLTRAADGVASFANDELTFIEDYLQNVEGVPAAGWGIYTLRHITKVITADQTGLRIPLDHLIQGNPLARIYIEAQNQGSSDRQHQFADDIVTRIRFRMNGTDEFEEIDAAEVQARNKVVYGLSSVLAGRYCLDFCEDMRVEPGAIPVVGRGETPAMYLDVDYTGANNEHRVVVTTEQLLYPSSWLK